MKTTRFLPLVVMSLLAVFVSCKGGGFADEANGERIAGHKPSNAIYHWKTTFDPDSVEWAFISLHNVGRMYVRMFDVDWEVESAVKAVPIATTLFRQSIPDTIEVVPTVYVVKDVLLNSTDEELSVLARRICNRVMAMCEANGIPNVREIQIDCDWTSTTKHEFDVVCKAMKAHLPDSVMLSSTIRLHQLGETPPPVDCGVLMVYNTGGIKNPQTRNSIFDKDDIFPYLRDVNYRLPLDVAYPAFEWSLLYRGGKSFGGILYRMDWSDTQLYYKIDETHYRVLVDHDCGEAYLRAGDVIRVERPYVDDILQVKQVVGQKLNRHGIVLYHLDSKNLLNYTDNEIHEIFVGN